MVFQGLEATSLGLLDERIGLDRVVAESMDDAPEATIGEWVRETAERQPSRWCVTVGEMPIIVGFDDDDDDGDDDFDDDLDDDEADDDFDDDDDESDDDIE